MLGDECTPRAPAEPEWIHEAHMETKVPESLGQTLGPGCGQGVGPVGIMAFTRDGHRAACGCWALGQLQICL